MANAPTIYSGVLGRMVVPTKISASRTTVQFVTYKQIKNQTPRMRPTHGPQALTTALVNDRFAKERANIHVTITTAHTPIKNNKLLIHASRTVNCATAAGTVTIPVPRMHQIKAIIN